MSWRSVEKPVCPSLPKGVLHPIPIIRGPADEDDHEVGLLRNRNRQSSLACLLHASNFTPLATEPVRTRIKRLFPPCRFHSFVTCVLGQPCPLNTHHEVQNLSATNWSDW
ncbi:hypothetical protein CRM22_000291 [Opisthorchis felineus]|uniref:Uncharacterized protein n=1 Tax=Opisthorchis felineus TaxID=147828 RepID=A0A4S2MFN9_OPIFE|nr:hypothetical protein CRM22_000291 [Opisthorchis felineus]